MPAPAARKGDVIMDESTGRTGDDAVTQYLSRLDEPTVADSRALIAMMSRVSGHGPKLWNVGTIGFDTYHFKYDSGREGDNHAIAFYPRRGKITIYLMDGTARHTGALAGLGKHTTSRVCVYFKRLSDVDVSTLESVLRESYNYLKSHDGRMHRS
jgi:hypothetical protein